MGKQETGTILVFGVNPYFSTETFHNQLANGKSQSTTLRIFIQLFETIEYCTLFFRGYATTCI